MFAGITAIRTQSKHTYGQHLAALFVRRYNGHPDAKSLKFQLDSSDTAVVIGNGNVAIDVARVLLEC